VIKANSFKWKHCHADTITVWSGRIS